MEAWLTDDLYEQRRGATDSELLFLLIVGNATACWHQRRTRPTWARNGVMSVLQETPCADENPKGIEARLRFAAALADAACPKWWGGSLVQRRSADQLSTLCVKRAMRGGWAALAS
ncbi:MAG: hypothetical protein IPG42_10045 [Betaproteobacteria bacterium]|nr:hypothetical protein [Betaproteobacteria bacterium]